MSEELNLQKLKDEIEKLKIHQKENDGKIEVLKNVVTEIKKIQTENYDQIHDLLENFNTFLEIIPQHKKITRDITEINKKITFFDRLIYKNTFILYTLVGLAILTIINQVIYLLTGGSIF